MLLSTCTNCLDGAHRRCEDRHLCRCSICKRPERTGDYVPNQHPRVEATPVAPVVDLPTERAKRPSKVEVAKKRELSRHPDAIAKRAYMREYRQRKRDEQD